MTNPLTWYLCAIGLPSTAFFLYMLVLYAVTWRRPDPALVASWTIVVGLPFLAWLLL